MAGGSQNILMFCSWFPNRVYPINGNFIEKHIRLIAQTHKVTAFQVEYDPALSFWQSEWIESREVNYDLLTIYYGSSYGKIIRIIRQLFLAWLAFRYLKRRNETFDFMHIHIAMPGVVLGWFLKFFYKLPFVLSCHSSGFLENISGAFPRWQKRFLVACANHAKVVCLVSTALIEGFVKNGLRVSTSIIPNVVNTRLFYPAAASPFFPPLKLLHISNFEPKVKNVEGILRVAKQLCLKGISFELTIAGDGDLERIRSYAVSLGLPKHLVHFHGTLTETEVATMMRQHHLFLLFSNYETQGVTLLEAQCCGLGIIATRVGGIPEIVSEKWMGSLVEAGDEKALTVQIEQHQKHYTSAYRQRISDDAMAKYSETAVKALFDEVYGCLL